jgi:hypothetical protein
VKTSRVMAAALKSTSPERWEEALLEARDADAPAVIALLARMEPDEPEHDDAAFLALNFLAEPDAGRGAVRLALTWATRVGRRHAG